MSHVAQDALAFGEKACVVFLRTESALYGIRGTGYKVAGFLSGDIHVRGDLQPLGTFALSAPDADMEVKEFAAKRLGSLAATVIGQGRPLTILDAATAANSL